MVIANTCVQGDEGWVGVIEYSNYYFREGAGQNYQDAESYTIYTLRRPLNNNNATTVWNIETKFIELRPNSTMIEVGFRSTSNQYIIMQNLFDDKSLPGQIILETLLDYRAIFCGDVNCCCCPSQVTNNLANILESKLRFQNAYLYSI